MYALRILPALAVIGLVAAVDSDGCSQSTITINSQGDADALANCDTLDGDVVIGPSASQTIKLDGAGKITGDLKCENAGNLTAISSSSITEIGGAFNLTGLTTLSNLQFDALTSVGSLAFTALPALSELGFTKEISKADTVLVTNTFLSTLDGINLDSVTDLDINNNRRLSKFSTSLTSISGSLNVNSNGNGLSIEFPNLESCANMTIKNISDISLPSLSVINASLGFYGNTFQSLALPNLTTVGITNNGNNGGISVVDNSQLSNLTLPQLSKSGGQVQLVNNTNLHDISLPQIGYVGGAIQILGNFTTPEMPKLTNVVGAFDVESQQSIDCSSYDKEKGDAIQGKYACTQTSKPAGTATGGSSSSTSTKKSSADQYHIHEAAAGLSVVSGLLQMLL